MITCTTITDLNVPEVGKPLVERLCRLWPEGGDGRYDFRITLPDNDPRLPKIFAELLAAGLRQEQTGKWNAYRPGKEFSVFKTIRFEDADYATARYLSWYPLGLHPSFDEENDGLPPIRLLSLESSLKRAMFAVTDFKHLIASDRGREALEGSHFVGISFVPAYFVDERSDVQELRDSIAAGGPVSLGNPAVWEVRPTITLPPMLPLRYTHRIAGEARASRNPIDVDWRMAYAAKDLDQIGQFDFARPSPHDDPNSTHQRSMVVSQRFFQFMKAHKKVTLQDWMPVREE